MSILILLKLPLLNYREGVNLSPMGDLFSAGNDFVFNVDPLVGGIFCRLKKNTFSAKISPLARI